MRILLLTLTLLAVPAAASEPGRNASTVPAAVPGPAIQQLSTERFLELATSASRFALDASELAVQRVQEEPLKTLAQKISTTQRLAEQSLRSTLEDAKMQMPSADQNDEQKQRLAKLRGLKGKDFTKAFLLLEIDAHQNAVALYSRYLKNGEDDKVAELARKLLPAFEENLELARELANPNPPPPAQG